MQRYDKKHVIQHIFDRFLHHEIESIYHKEALNTTFNLMKIRSQILLN